MGNGWIIIWKMDGWIDGQRMDGQKMDGLTENGWMEMGRWIDKNRWMDQKLINLMDWMAEKWTDGYGWRENG